jgi:acyl-CoA dehydrogenase
MRELEDWRTEVRAWLEANCPPPMRRPITSDADFCWGGRRWQFQSPEQRLWLER